MKKKEIVFEKQFSALEGLQEERLTRYIITTNPGAESILYGIELEESDRWGVRRAAMEPLSDSREQVALLITFLYERAVGLTSFRDVLSDRV